MTCVIRADARACGGRLEFGAGSRPGRSWAGSGVKPATQRNSYPFWAGLWSAGRPGMICRVDQGR